MITNRPYLLMRTWTPKLGSRRLIDFSTPSNTTAVNFLLWFSDIRDSKTPSRLNQDCLTDDLKLHAYSWRQYAHQLMWRKAGYSQNQVWIHPTSQTKELNCFTYCSYLHFYRLSLSLTSYFPTANLSFPIPLHLEVTNSPSLSLLTLSHALCIQTGSPGKLSQKNKT